MLSCLVVHNCRKLMRDSIAILGIRSKAECTLPIAQAVSRPAGPEPIGYKSLASSTKFTQRSLHYPLVALHDKLARAISEVYAHCLCAIIRVDVARSFA
ncbi:hypothetical protein M378DRAFT_645580 [Amanita muscaria Koide BX008]|uniref:Uncharacterized protein n=1 Tax=Amanita muscaria (strain Koide BX008) TaxID=946122 RepID=A0A0C2RY18_AMAMK|nr:hypothetical protein M378DRAFT_645580 [Amanita muscaria Koide BX008]